LTQFIALQEENKQNCWLQQSGANIHTMKTTTALLQAFFSDCIVRCGLWPPWSLDLTPPEFFQWGFLKRRVYSHNPRSLKDLKHNMAQEQQTLQKLQKTLWKEWMIIFKNVREGGRGAFSASAVVTHCLSHSWYLWQNKIK